MMEERLRSWALKEIESIKEELALMRKEREQPSMDLDLKRAVYRGHHQSPRFEPPKKSLTEGEEFARILTKAAKKGLIRPIN